MPVAAPPPALLHLHPEWPVCTHRVLAVAPPGRFLPAGRRREQHHRQGLHHAAVYGLLQHACCDVT